MVALLPKPQQLVHIKHEPRINDQISLCLRCLGEYALKIEIAIDKTLDQYEYRPWLCSSHEPTKNYCEICGNPYSTFCLTIENGYRKDGQPITIF